MAAPVKVADADYKRGEGCAAGEDGRVSRMHNKRRAPERERERDDPAHMQSYTCTSRV